MTEDHKGWPFEKPPTVADLQQEIDQLRSRLDELARELSNLDNSHTHTARFARKAREDGDKTAQILAEIGHLIHVKLGT